MAQRAKAMAGLAGAEGCQVIHAETQRQALALVRERQPDLVWAGTGLQEGSLEDLFSLLRAGYPALPCLGLLPRTRWNEALALLDGGAFDVQAEGEDARVYRAALRRALADARARARVDAERGRMLGMQNRMLEVGPVVEEMLAGLAGVLHQHRKRPDISLRHVESVCANALLRILDKGQVVVLAYERKSGVLRPRVTTNPGEVHDAMAERGFSIPEHPDGAAAAVLSVVQSEEAWDLIREQYGARQVHLALLGTQEEPYGVVAFFPDRATPPSPEERELLDHLTVHASHCLDVVRSFRTALRRASGSLA